MACSLIGCHTQYAHEWSQLVDQHVYHKFSISSAKNVPERWRSQSRRENVVVGKNTSNLLYGILYPNGWPDHLQVHWPYGRAEIDILWIDRFTFPHSLFTRLDVVYVLRVIFTLVSGEVSASGDYLGTLPHTNGAEIDVFFFRAEWSGLGQRLGVAEARILARISHPDGKTKWIYGKDDALTVDRLTRHRVGRLKFHIENDDGIISIREKTSGYTNSLNINESD